MVFAQWICSLKWNSPHLPPPSKEKKKEEGRVERETAKKGFPFPFLKSLVFPSWIQVLWFFSVLSKKWFRRHLTLCGLWNQVFLLQKCFSGQISTARRKGRAETVFSIIASIFPLLLAVDSWPATIKEMSDWFRPPCCCFLCLKCCLLFPSCHTPSHSSGQMSPPPAYLHWQPSPSTSLIAAHSLHSPPNESPVAPCYTIFQR